VLLPENDDRAGIVARISMVENAPQLTERDGTTRPLGKGEILTYGRVRIEVCGAGSEIDDKPDHTPEKPRSIPAQPKSTVASKSKSKVKWYS